MWPDMLIDSISFFQKQIPQKQPESQPSKIEEKSGFFCRTHHLYCCIAFFVRYHPSELRTPSNSIELVSMRCPMGARAHHAMPHACSKPVPAFIRIIAWSRFGFSPVAPRLGPLEPYPPARCGPIWFITKIAASRIVSAFFIGLFFRRPSRDPARLAF